MDTREKLTFKIDVFTPETLPMARLAEYLTHLSSLYGNTENVHFDKVKKGSAILQVVIEEQAFPKVIRRLRSINSNKDNNNQDVKKAYKSLDCLLRSDNAIGSINVAEGAKILEFPGRKLIVQENQTISQNTTVDGMIIKIGGKDDTIPVTLLNREGKTINCQVRGQTYAKELSAHYLGAQLRVHGIGKWIRNADGLWDIETLFIQSHEELDDSPLDDVLTEFKNIKDNGWKNISDPLSEWKKIRGIE